MTERQIPTQAQVDAAWERWCAQSDLPAPYRVWLHGEDHTEARYAEWVLGLERRRAEPARPDDLARLATRARFVDPAELICPGCGYMVCPQPPVYVEADAPAGSVTPQFSHRDGTALCPLAGGAICEPVEIETLS